MQHDHIISLLKSLPIFKSYAEQTLTYEKLKQGESNNVYLIRHHKQSYLLRLPPQQILAFINRQHEFDNNQQAIKWGLTPKLLHFDVQTGIMLREFVAGKPPTDTQGKLLPAVLPQLANLLSQLHQQTAKFTNTINIFTVIKDTLQQLEQSQATLPNAYQTLLPQVIALEKTLQTLKPLIAPCHGDLVPYNLIWNTQKLWLIDWEFSGNNDPAWDIAYLFHYSQLTSETITTFWQYYALTSDSLKQRVILYAPIVDYLHALTLRQWLINKWFPHPAEKLLQWEAKSLATVGNKLCLD